MTAKDDFDAIRARHAQFADVPFDIESHEHGQKGCRCLSCNVTTGWAIHAGRDCDEHPDAANASGGGCIRGVLEYDQAAYLVQAVADVAALLAIVDDMAEDTQPWPTMQPMPYVHVGERAQPWHIRAVMAYDTDRGTATDMANLTAKQVNEAIVWWNTRAQDMS